jgi:hypothetical protein
MLLPPNQSLRLSTVFAGLYALKLEVIRASCGGRQVDSSRMPDGLWAAACSNADTNAAIVAFIAAVQALSDDDRYDLTCLTHYAPKVSDLMADSTLPIPQPPAAILTPLKNLVVHLFDRTSKLKKIEKSCGESLQDFFLRYSSPKPIGNGNVCSVCCTDVLAQYRHGIPAAEQWRAAFDHLLAEATYPLLSLDPVNLLPVCYHCNSKAKLADDLLHDELGNRRISLNPWTESAHGQVSIAVSVSGYSPSANVEFAPLSIDQSEKLGTWDAAYQIRSRVMGAFRSLPVTISTDLALNDLQAFRSSITQREQDFKSLARAHPYHYWRSLLYAGMAKLPDAELEKIRSVCHAGLQNNGLGFSQSFGV